jgi:hypothetical protein
MANSTYRVRSMNVSTVKKSKAAKTRPSHPALQDLQLVAKDHHLDVAVQMTGGANDKLDQSAQQQVHEREEHGRNLPRG